MIRKLAWLYIDRRRLLCARTDGRKTFYIPGGKPEAGESDLDALAREIREELGVSLIPLSLAFHGHFEAPADGKPGLVVAVDAYEGRCDGTPAPSGEIAELRFLTASDAAPVSAVTRLILDSLKADNVID